MSEHHDPGDSASPPRLGLLVSGQGTTVLHLHECCTTGRLRGDVAIVISSRASAPAVERCRRAGLRVEIVERGGVPDPRFHEQIAALLRQADVRLVCMAGFTCLWRIPDDFAGRVLNIHPALLPAFGGKGFYGDRVHRAVLESGVTETGCTVHLADNVYDHGPIILERRVPVLPGDTVATLSARVRAEEKIAYPEAIRIVSSRP